MPCVPPAGFSMTQAVTTAALKITAKQRNAPRMPLVVAAIISPPAEASLERCIVMMATKSAVPAARNM
jgi:hypothetical protein